MTTGAVERGTESAGSGSERWYLNDEREFLLRSIDDAERERGAGDLSEADYEVLVARDRARLAEVEAELAALGPDLGRKAPADKDADSDVDPDAPEVAPRRRYGTWSRVGIVVACLFILAGAVILVDHAVSPAAPGQAPSGTVTLSKAQQVEDQLAAADVLTENGEDQQALELYNKVLTEDPDDPYALAAGGWLEWNAGVSGKSAATERAGRASEEKAVRVAPQFAGGHLYLGLILLDQDDNATGAIKQFTAFLGYGSKAEIKSFASQIEPAWSQAHEPLPAALAAVTASTTTTTTTTTSAP